MIFKAILWAILITPANNRLDLHSFKQISRWNRTKGYLHNR